MHTVDYTRAKRAKGGGTLVARSPKHPAAWRRKSKQKRAERHETRHSSPDPQTPALNERRAERHDSTLVTRSPDRRLYASTAKTESHTACGTVLHNTMSKWLVTGYFMF